MRVSEIPQADFARSLANTGVCLACGPFVVRVASPCAEVASGLHFHYGAFDLPEDGAFVDFDVRLGPPSMLRRFVRPQVNFSCDGRVPFKPLPAAQAFPMLEWGLNWVISSHAHDYLVLHGAVVECHGRALILAADPGSGKSTLCAALINRGWRLLSDELTLVDLQSGGLRPIARPVSLKNESIEVARMLGGNVCIGAVCRGTTKGDVAHMRPPVESVERRLEPASPTWVIFPKFIRGARMSIDGVGKAHAFMEMMRHVFNYALLGEAAFTALGRLVDRCSFLRMHYGHLDQVLPEIDALVDGSPDR